MENKLPKLTLTERPTPAILLTDKPAELDNKFGKSYLYRVSVAGLEMVYFASPKTHQKIQETGAGENTEIWLSKTALESGKSWIVVDRRGGKKQDPLDKRMDEIVRDLPPIDIDHKQKLITSQFLIGRAVDVWVRLNEHDPAAYTRADMRMDLLDIAVDIHRALNTYVENYYDDPKRLPRKEMKRDEDPNIPF